MLSTLLDVYEGRMNTFTEEKQTEEIQSCISSWRKRLRAVCRGNGGPLIICSSKLKLHFLHFGNSDYRYLILICALYKNDKRY